MKQGSILVGCILVLGSGACSRSGEAPEEARPPARVPAVQPVAEPAVEPVAEPAAQPVAEPAVEPVGDPDARAKVRDGPPSPQEKVETGRPVRRPAGVPSHPPAGGTEKVKPPEKSPVDPAPFTNVPVKEQTTEADTEPPVDEPEKTEANDEQLATPEPSAATSPATGKISGVVSTRKPASTGSVKVKLDQEACGKTQPSEALRVVGGKVARAVISLDGVKADNSVKPGKATLDQKACAFVPRVQAVTKGTKLTIINSDPVLHNVHATVGGKRNVFNIALPIQGQTVRKKLKKTGVMQVVCDAGHTWMRAYIHVFDHRYFAVSSDDGRFEIPDVPPGTYTLKVWQESLGTKSVEVTVPAGGEVKIDVEL